MKFEKANAEMVSFFDAIAPAAGAGIEKRKMFGYPCRFVNGNLFMGLHNNNMILRLPENDRADFVKRRRAALGVKRLDRRKVVNRRHLKDAEAESLRHRRRWAVEHRVRARDFDPLRA